MSWQLITLTPEASTLAMLMLDFGGFGLAAFSGGRWGGTPTRIFILYKKNI
jgi:hypothetical protein